MLKKGYLASTNFYASTAHSEDVLNLYFEALSEVYKIISECEIGNIKKAKSKAKPRCLSKSKAASLRAKGGKKAIGAAVKKKRRQDPNKNRKGKAKNVSNTKGK